MFCVYGETIYGYVFHHATIFTYSIYLQINVVRCTALLECLNVYILIIKLSEGISYSVFNTASFGRVSLIMKQTMVYQSGVTNWCHLFCVDRFRSNDIKWCV